MTKTQLSLPKVFIGTVIKGFGRGSRELGIPTANLDENVVNSMPTSLLTGIYYGFAQVDDSPVYKMVMSIGWNPYYKNNKRTAEVHILNQFDEDFYGATLKIIILGYIRPERNYSSKEDLIRDIKNDISISAKRLDDPQYAEYYTSAIFTTSGVTNGVQHTANGENNALSAECQ